MAFEGWKATGLLAPLWRKYPGGRDALALAVGTKPPTLSAINTGRRNLGWNLGQRLANELGVSVLELGAPSEHEPEPRDMFALLERLAVESERGLAAIAEALVSIDVRLSQIEERLPIRAKKGSNVTPPLN